MHSLGRFFKSFSLWLPVLCGAAFLGAILVQSALMAESAPEPQERGMRFSAEPSKIKEGEFPPDFELPYLMLEINEEGKNVGIISDSKTFKLSSFQGKRPVCMIMSSYT